MATRNKIMGEQALASPPGLMQVYPSPMDHGATRDKTLDIVVLHGLAARSPKTWLAYKNGVDETNGFVNWLCDPHMLPAKMPNARVLAYSWNANYARDAARELFVGHADSLLRRITYDREENNKEETPLIFIASCFGGLLLAKALARATEPTHAERANSRIINSTIGIVTLGTPFRGSWAVGNIAAEGKIAYAAAAAAAGEGFQYSAELSSLLSRSTPDKPSQLDELVLRFTELINGEKYRIPLVCFYETLPTSNSVYFSALPVEYQKKIDPKAEGIVVEEDSACIQGQRRISLDVRHNMMHKYRSPHDDGFVQICGVLRAFTEKVKEESNSDQAIETPSHSLHIISSHNNNQSSGEGQHFPGAVFHSGAFHFK